MPRLKTGDQAPSIVLPSIDGTTFDMSLMKGRELFSPSLDSHLVLFVIYELTG